MGWRSFIKKMGKILIGLASLILISGCIALVEQPEIYSAVEHNPEYQNAMCTRVVDGDTIVVKIGLDEFKVRYIGIDTPETVDPNRPVGYFGKEASQKNKELVLAREVKLEKDVSDTDRYGRLLRYVYVGDVMINAELVRLGYAKASIYPPDVKYSKLFVQLEREARNNGVGLWAE